MDATSLLTTTGPTANAELGQLVDDRHGDFRREQSRPIGAKGQGEQYTALVIALLIALVIALYSSALRGVPTRLSVRSCLSFDDLLKHGSRSGLQRYLHRTSL